MNRFYMNSFLEDLIKKIKLRFILKKCDNLSLLFCIISLNRLIRLQVLTLPHYLTLQTCEVCLGSAINIKRIPSMLIHGLLTVQTALIVRGRFSVLCSQ